MFGLFRTRLFFKVGVLAALAVLTGFGVLAVVLGRIQQHAIDDMHHASARAIATSLAAGVRNSMLTGNGIAVRDLLHDAKAGLETADVHVYAPSGEEVFGPKPPPPSPDTQPVWVRAVLSTHTHAAVAATGAEATPIENEKRCRECHEPGDLRGVLTLGTKGASIPVDGSDASLDALASIARSAFVQIMTAKQQDRLDDFFAELSKTAPGIRGVAVYTTVAERKFGEDTGLPDDVVLRGVERVPAFTEARGGLRYRVVPLPNDKRCQGCHSPKEDMRGALVVAFEPAKLDGSRTLSQATSTALSHVMLSGLGRMITGFMDDVAHTGLVTTLTVHDDAGRLYHDAFATYDPPSAVRTVLQTRRHLESPDEAMGKPEFLLVEPLANDLKCQRCHGPDQPLRGAIAIKLDTSKEHAMSAKLRMQGGVLGGLTIATALGLLWLVLRMTVLMPVAKIGRVADRVGEGDFDARLSVTSSDEMGRLAQRINDMVTGLRQKVALSKFVSQETLKRVEDDRGSALSRTGARRRVTMLFSDVRGFTAFSETRSPEEVVAMLNEYLQAQAEVVLEHGGDIDKFVGDELMARFMGEDAEARAARCAVEMIEAVAKLESRASHSLAVGVGVNAGEVVLGSMGAEHRLDYTVVGDAVNLAARLCSAAKGNEVLVTQTIREATHDATLAFEPLDPIRVKGKADPIAVFRVTRTKS